MPEFFIGLMSGTSMDAVDALLADFATTPPTVVAHCALAIPADLRTELAELLQPGNDGLDRLGAVDVRLGHLFAAAAKGVLEGAGRGPEAIRAIGSHGQTVRHRPGGNAPFSLQIGDPNIIAEQTGITTVADFRRRDLAAGGQGAPLAPAFHAALFGGTGAHRVVLNLGGIANITLLPAAQADPVYGFDIGPANTLLDAWAQRHLGVPLDEDGRWAAQGRPDEELLARLLADPYFDLPPPKSTGREQFNIAWLERHLTGDEKPADVQATLCQLTARTVAAAIVRHAAEGEEVLVCGGGAYNSALMGALEHHLAGRRVASTARYGLEPRWIEALAFAWLARQTLNGLAGNLPTVTGAERAVILGGIYPGRGYKRQDTRDGGRGSN